jgi:hypothetical protein
MEANYLYARRVFEISKEHNSAAEEADFQMRSGKMPVADHAAKRKRLAERLAVKLAEAHREFGEPAGYASN